MIPKVKEKEKAIKLRKQGKTYSEILKEVSVTKSTLSLWLRDVGLAKAQQQRITEKRRDAQIKGGAARRQHRIESTSNIYSKAIREVGKLSKRERWMIGTALYWAEGSKERVSGQSIDFGNTDAHMLKFFIDWLHEFLEVNSDDISFGLYIHESHEHRLDEIKNYWRKSLGVSNLKISFIYFKKHNPKTNRKNTGENYYGTLRMRVKKSTDAQRKIQGWIYGITGKHCPVV